MATPLIITLMSQRTATMLDLEWLNDGRGRRLYVQRKYPVAETVFCLPENILVLIADPEKAEENVRKLEVIGKRLAKFSVQLLKKGNQEHA